MKVLKKQTNSKKCIICGIDNPFGLKAPFYEMEDGTVITLFQYQELHQSYPERTHGGMICCMLDELIGRAIWIEEPGIWGVTTNLEIKYRKPVPYDTPLKGIGKIIENRSRLFKGHGQILDLEGNVLAEATATYLKLPLEKISTSNHEDVNVMVPDDIKEI